MASLAGIRGQIGYKRRPGSNGGKPSLAATTLWDRQFDLAAPHPVCVTEITYIRDGGLSLSGRCERLVFPRRGRLVDAESVYHRCSPAGAGHCGMAAQTLAAGAIHSDQGSLYTSMDWAVLTRFHNLEHSMTRHGNAMTLLSSKASCRHSGVSASDVGPTKYAKKRGRTCLTTLKCPAAQCASRSETNCSRPPNSNGRSFWKLKGAGKLAVIQCAQKLVLWDWTSTIVVLSYVLCQWLLCNMAVSNRLIAKVEAFNPKRLNGCVSRMCLSGLSRYSM